MNELSFSALSDFVVRGAGGKLDFDATVEKFSTRLLEFEAVVGLESEQIGAAVHAVFDRFPGANSINMDAIVGFALPNLNPTPDNHNILKDRIKDYIRINSDRPEKKDKVTKVVLAAGEPDRTRDFHIAKGKGGGVKRWADHPLKPADPVNPAPAE